LEYRGGRTGRAKLGERWLRPFYPQIDGVINWRDHVMTK
jgi:hypothetical protein